MLLQTSFTSPIFKNHKDFYSSITRPNSVGSRINKLKSLRLCEPSKELERLANNNFISRKLSKIKDLYKSEGIYFGDLHQMAYGHSLELFEKFQDDHYVFTHGQSGSCLLGLTILNGMLLEARRSKPLLPFQVALGESSQFDGIKSLPAAWYKQNIVPGNNDHNYKDFILSADVRLLSVAQAESALSFFLGESDRDRHIKEKIVTELALRLIPGDKFVQANFINEFTELDTEICKGPGNLFTICIPKEKDFEDYGYLSTACGFALEDEGNVVDLLDQFQKEEDFRSDPLHDYYSPQIRLVRHKLHDPDVQIFACVSRADALFESQVQKMRELVKKYFPHLFSQKGVLFNE